MNAKLGACRLCYDDWRSVVLPFGSKQQFTTGGSVYIEPLFCKCFGGSFVDRFAGF